MRAFLLKFFILLLAVSLFACTGGAGPGGAAGPIGGPSLGEGITPPGATPPGLPPPGAGAATASNGTVGSQAGLPGLQDNDCLSKYLMLFGGESAATPSGTLPPPGEATPTVLRQPILYTLASNQTSFPDRAIVNIQSFVPTGEQVVQGPVLQYILSPCEDCQILRFVDLGVHADLSSQGPPILLGDPNAEATTEQFGLDSEFGLLFFFNSLLGTVHVPKIKGDLWKIATYQDFRLDHGEASLSGLPIKADGLYLFLVAPPNTEFVGEPTAFGKEEDFNAMMSCQTFSPARAMRTKSPSSPVIIHPNNFPRLPSNLILNH